MKNKRVYIPAFVRAAEFKDDQNEFDFIITSDKEDTYETVFTHDGWNFERYTENPVVFYQHRSDSDDPDNLIGITVKGPWAEQLEDGSNAWLARVRFEPAEVNEKAEKIRKKIIAGSIRMASIGADVQAYRWGNSDKNENPDTLYFTKKELFEWSVVHLGSNPSAHIQRNAKVIEEIRKERTPGNDGQDENNGKGASMQVAVNRLELAKLKSKR